MRGWKWGLAVATAAMMLGIFGGKGEAAPARRAPSPAEQYGMEEADRDDGLLQDVVLGTHNDERSRWGLTPLAWDRTLAADAARYARQMARTNIFAHSSRATRAVPSGENLWMGSRGLYDYEVMVGAFLNERRYFRRAGKMPNFSTTGRWQDVAHYTQIIWRGTRSVGCALAEGRSFDYLVCRYYPAGNMFGMGPLDAAPVLAGGEE